MKMCSNCERSSAEYVWLENGDGCGDIYLCRECIFVMFDVEQYTVYTLDGEDLGRFEDIENKDIEDMVKKIIKIKGGIKKIY